MERSITLAKEFRRAVNGADFLFVFPDNEILTDRLASEAFPYKTHSPTIMVTDHLAFLRETLNDFQPNLILSDQGDTSHEIMRIFRATQALVLSFDDLGEGGYSAHILVDANREKENTSKKKKTHHSPVNGYKQIYQIEQTELFGAEYMLLKPQFAEQRRKRGIPPLKPKHVLVAMGGGDKNGASIKAINGILDSGIGEIQGTVILGMAFSMRKELEETLQGRWEIHTGVPNMAEYMLEADIGIISGGITLYEAASIGLPSITICTAIHQLPIATRLESDGCTICMEMDYQISETDIGECFSSLYKDWQKRIYMSQRGKVLVDGKGIFRIVDAVMAQLKIKGIL